MWWVWVLGGSAVWLVVGFAVALVVGKGIRLADQRELGVPRAARATSHGLRSVRVEEPRRPHTWLRRRAVPLPPLGVALAATAVMLETVGLVSRMYGFPLPLRHIVSMQMPFSLPRLYVAGLFAAAAFAAFAGARVLPGRRSWWLGVGLVASCIALVKTGSTLHRDASRALVAAVGSTAALLLSALGAAAVLAALWFLSRDDRRDRRRVLGVLACYAVAAVGFSAVTSLLEHSLGMRDTATMLATYVEESGEALSGVGFLFAVLAGVAPRVVLPRTWPLRRAVDAQTLDLPHQLPGRSGAGAYWSA